jgi:glycosyltransferase involved in cell wall biosynthesis
MRVALVHDWLNGMRGGEKVLESLLAIFPEATIFTLFHERGKVSPLIESHRIVTSGLDRIPGIYRIYRNLLPLFPRAIESFDFSPYNLVVSSSHAVAKGINPHGAPHICYCHTPMRYIWDAEGDYRMNPLTHTVFRMIRGPLRTWDRESSKRVTQFIANSHFVQERIRRYYERESDIVPPPVDTDFFKVSESSVREDFYLATGALVPYKRFDLVVRVFNSLGKRLIIAGSGPELKKLRNMASSTIDIRGWVSNQELRRLYRSAKALVYVAREDFGIVGVEAQSCGCPVIANGIGGMAEIVREGVNGLLFAEQRESDVINAIERFEKMKWPPKQVSEGVERFSRGIFEAKIRHIIQPYTRQNPGEPFAPGRA